MKMTVRFFSVLPQFRARKPYGWPGASHLSSPSTNRTKGLPPRRLFRVPQCRKGTTNIRVYSGIRTQSLRHRSQRH
ncbi:hypothetical protein TNCV_2559691 [Trichonephila clavipes]|nr:hypothetical protein TNCV_2559691 [Trichonephila clavipes]